MFIHSHRQHCAGRPNKHQRRRQIVEKLEQRQLLAGDWNDQRTELASEIDRLSTFASHVESVSNLSQPLAIVGSSFNQNLDFSNALSTEFVTPLKTFLDDAGRATGAQSVVDFLTDELNAGVVLSATTSAQGAEQVFETTLFLTQSVGYRPQFDPAAAEHGLSFDDSQSSAEFGVTLALQFGADVNDEFFVKVDRMEFSVVDAVEVSAVSATPDYTAIDRDITFTLQVNETIGITATLAAHTNGNQTPLVDRLNAALRTPLRDAGLAGAIQAVDTGGRLSFRGVSPIVQSLSLSGDSGLGLLGFSPLTESSKTFRPGAQYGLLSLESSGGGLAVAGVLDVHAHTGADDRLDSIELSGAPGLTYSSSGFVQAALNVRPTTDGLFDGAPVIAASSGTLFRGEPIAVALQAFEPIEALHDQATETLRRGFTAITQFGARLESDAPFAAKLPAMDTTLADVADLETLLRDSLQSQVESLLASNSRPTWDEVADALNQVNGVNVSAPAQSNQRVSFDIALDLSNNSTQKLALGRDVTDAGFGTPDDLLPDLNVATRTDWSLAVDIDRAGTASPMNAFSVAFDHADQHIDISDDVSFQAKVGFLDVNAAGDVDFSATMQSRVGQAGQWITAGRLINQPIESFVTHNAAGDFDVHLNLSGTLGGTTIEDGSVVMDVAGSQIFDGQSQLQLDLVPAGRMADFANLSADDLASGLRQIGGWLGDFAEEKLGDSIPLAETLRYIDLLDLKAVFEEVVASQLTGADDQLSFSSAQQLGSPQVVPGISNPQYDAANKTLSFDVDFSKVFSFDLSDQLAFDFDVGDFVGFETNSEVTLTPLIEGRFRLGVDMRPLGAGDSATLIDRRTTLESIGVTVDAGDDVEISLREGSSVRVSFDGAADLGDIVDAINIASSKLHAEFRVVDGITVGLQVTDRSVDGGNVFRIRSVDESLTGLALGILGEFEADDDDPNAPAVVVGLPLHGDTIAHHVFVEEFSGAPIATGTISLTADDFSATANLGFTEVSISGGDLLSDNGVPSHVTAAVALPRPKMTLAELFAELESAIDASVGGLIQFTLPVSGTIGGTTYGGGESLTATISDFSGDLSASLSGSIDAILEQLADVDAGDVLRGLIEGLENLLSVDDLTLPVLDINLPDAIGLPELLADLTAAIDSIGSATLDVLSQGVNRMAQVSSTGELAKIDFPEIAITLPDLFQFLSSAGDVAPIADPGGPDDGKFSLPDLNGLFANHFDFEIDLPDVKVSPSDFDAFLGGVSTILDQLQLSGPGSLQGLESALESATGLPADAIGLQIDTSVADAISVRFDLMLDKMIQAKYPLRVDLADLGIDGIGNLIDVSASSEMTLSAGAAAMLSLGVQVNSGGVKPFLYTDASGTRLTLSAGASANNIDFEASLGPFGIGIVDGVAGIGVPGPGPTDPLSPATFELTFDDADGRFYFLEESSDLNASSSGGAFVRLPLEAPLGSAPINIQMDVADLTNPTFQFSLWDALFANPEDLNGDSQFDSADVAQAIQDKIDAFGNVGDNLLSLVGGWEGAFDLLIDTMKGEVLGVPLPIIGDALADQATFLEDVKQSVLDNIEGIADQGVTVVQTAIFDALGPSGLGVLQDRDDDGDTVLDFRDVKATVLSDRVEFDLDMSQDLASIMLGGAFDLGLPGLNFDLDADVSLDLGFSFKLGFGVSIDEGFYFVTDEARTDLGVTFTAEVEGLDATGRLGFLELNAQNVDGSPTQFVGNFDVDISDAVVGDDNGRLSLSEMFSGDFSDVVSHSLTAQADAAIRMELSAGDTRFLPRIRADLIVDWNYGPGADPNGVSFENVQLNLGDFFGGFAGNTLREVQKILKPVQPIINVLTTRLPVLSDLGGRDVTLIDVARMFGRADVADFIESLVQVNDLITGLPPIDVGTWVDLGAFTLDPGSLGGYDGVGSTPSSMKKDLSFTVSAEPAQSPLTQTGNSGGGGWTNNLENAKGSLSFPLLESPATAFNLLLGKDVDLFLYDAPALGVDFRYNQNFPTPIPFLFAELGGRVAAVADFAFGFDTTGISRFRETGNAIDIFNGFFVSDRINPDGTGADVPEVYLRGSITAGAKVDVLLASAGVRGGIFADVDFNLHDNDRDGRVRAGEIAENFALGPIHIFDIDGKVDAGLTAFLDVNLLLFQISEEYEIARVNLLDFEIARPVSNAPTPESMLIESRVPKADGSGDVLTIKFTQQDDTYKILPGSQEGSIVIQGQGLITKDIVGVAAIVGNAGDGNDTVTISPQVRLPVTINGGTGDDVLTAGGGAVTFTGGAGNDQLTGGEGADFLLGDDGDDVLIAGGGSDTLRGGSGNDYLDGGRDQDFLLGGTGNDQLFGGDGADEADGQRGDDTIDGGAGNDVLLGGSGRDRISGGRGDDRIDGGDDDDELFGEEGADEIDGGRGNDLIEGGQRNDVLGGGDGDDTLGGGTGNDAIDGGKGDDLIRGGAAQDTLTGGDGNDLIFADDDEQGGTDPASHVISGGAGNDTIFGSIGVDVIDAGVGNDRVSALASADVIIGGLGDDDLDGGSGNDLVWGGEAAHLASTFDLSDPSLFEKPLRYNEATAMVDAATGVVGYSGYTFATLITPKIVAGLSVAGVPNDGNDVLRGGNDTDWLFGGSGNDAIFGGGGDDYIDGGSGNDANLFGDDGDDVIRGGSGVDVIHGGLGIDQIYGDEGRDTLYGDGGDANGSTDGQRLFGGDDVDSLFAWSADATTVGGKGDQLFGGSGGDFLYGNLRNDLLFGESGPDYISGDWAAGPNYLRNINAATLGGDDTLIGGSGQDQAYGGGGDDLIQGGGDGDWLEGQDGNDALFGGGGIDFLVLDVNPNYSEQLHGHGDGSPEDNATDVLMIGGTSGDDVIRISGTPDGRLRVVYNGSQIEAVWRDAGGVPVIEQFRIDGGAGDDQIQFAQGADALDLSDLIARSRDWVTVMSGGTGDDTLGGSSARDRIDGGFGSDIVSGFDGDDRLWGDDGDGSSADHDILFAGKGNDDLLGGQGSNDLYAWSFDPGNPGDSPFGVYELVDGVLQLEDTGLNRIIGGPGDDNLFGGTGLDLLYGGGGVNQFYTRTGQPFESLDGGDAGDAWKDYARSTDQVWYVGGTNADDEISVDFVTEPGLLLGHHLVTRSTVNGDLNSFDAQVRLDFAATDDDGNLIWDPDTLFSSDALQSDDPFVRAAALNEQFSDAISLSRLLPPEGDFRAIIIDALAGDDKVFVGPTVQKTVWIDAGDGDDRVQIATGRSILIDQTDSIDARNDTIENSYTLIGPPVLVGENAAPADGILTADASFYLIVDDLDEHVLIKLPASLTDGTADATSPNQSLDDLIDDLNRQIDASDAAGLVIATRAGHSIALSTNRVHEASRLAISIPDGDPAIDQLGLVADEIAVPTSELARDISFSGLTIDSPQDVDHYSFRSSLTSDVSIAAVSENERDGMQWTVFQADGTVIVPVDGKYALTAGSMYTVKVVSDATPTIYDLRFGFGDGGGVVSQLSQIVEFERQDVIFGGAGNDILQGGPGEDFIFGGPGNDVLTGGQDRGASDLLFGQEGDDTLQSIPDRLPLITGTGTTYIPTQSDRFDGGTGNDRVFFLGGDLDENENPVNDFVAVRFNRFLQRYELTTLMWDVDNGRYVSNVDDLGAAQPDFTQLYHFFAARDLELFQIDTRAGDDEVRMDAEFVFPGTTSEWGINEGDAQAGATLASFTINGGPGADRLFGGPGQDRIDGGIGADVIFGGGGNDQIMGGAGDDLLAGNTIVEPDVFELVSRNGQSQSNDRFEFAGVLPPIVPGGTVPNLNLHLLDPVDWYIVPAPMSINAFGEATTALLTEDMISVSADGGDPLTIDLYPALSTGGAAPDDLVPFVEFDGVPQYYFLRVSRPTNDTDLEARSYAIQYDPTIGQTIHAGARDEADRIYDSSQLGGQPVVIPAGDFNGDGYDDYVLSLRDSVVAGQVSTARLYFGNEFGIDPSLESIEITLPAPVRAVGDEGVQSTFGESGDYNGDGFDDLAIAVSPTGLLPANAIRINPGLAALRDRLRIQYDAGLSPTGSWTVEAWVATEDGDGQFNRIIRQPVGGAQTYSLLIKDGQAHIRFDRVVGSEFVQAGPQLDDGDLHHLAGVFDATAGVLILYVDGVEVGRKTTAGMPVQATEPLQIGGIDTSGTTGGPQFFDGAISEVRVWDKVRTRSELLDRSVDAASNPNLQLQLVFPDGVPTDQSIRRHDVELIGTLQDAFLDEDTRSIDETTNRSSAASAVYLLFGRPKAAVPVTGLDLVNDAGATIKGFDGPVAIGNAGSRNGVLSQSGHELEDLVIGEISVAAGNHTFIVDGRENWDTIVTALDADFETPLATSGFTVSGNAILSDASQGQPGHSAAFDVHFGNGVDYNTPSLTGTLASPLINLSAVDRDSTVLKFNYSLGTNLIEGIDIARVYVAFEQSGDPSGMHLIASNQISDLIVFPEALPLDETVGWRPFRYELGTLIDSVLTDEPGINGYQLIFQFDAVSTFDRSHSGFHVDDVVVERAANISDFADVQIDASAVSVVSIGSHLIGSTAPGESEIAFVDTLSNDLAQQTVQIHNVDGSGTIASITRAEGFLGFSVRAAGNIDGIDGDELIIAGRDVSYLVFGNTIGAGSHDLDDLVTQGFAVRFDVGNLFSIDDFNGDEIPDLAAVELADVTSIVGDRQITHPRTRIYFGTSEMRTNPALTIADVVLEPSDPLFDPAESAKMAAGAIASLGDIDGDGRDDLATALIGKLEIVNGRTLSAAVPEIVPYSVGETYEFQLAGPIQPNPGAPPSGIDLAGGASSVDIRQALSIGGAIPGDGISEVGSVGDVNGDGYEDFIVIGANRAFLLPGPVELVENWNVEEAASVIFDLTSLGRIMPSAGDINADGFNDLVFVKDVGALADIHVIFGRQVMPRFVGAELAGVDPQLGRTGVTFGGDAGDTALLLNWNGDGSSDLALVGPIGGRIYDGQALSGGTLQILNTFAPDETDRIQLVRATQGLAAATQVSSFRQLQTDTFQLTFEDQFNGMDSIDFDPETGHLFAHQSDNDSIREFDLDGNLINEWGTPEVPFPHMAEEGGISITAAPMNLAGVDLPANTLLVFVGNWISGGDLTNGPDVQVVVAFDKFTGERLAVLKTDLPITTSPFIQMEAGVYHPLRQTLFVLSSDKTVREIDPITGTTLRSFVTPIAGSGGGFGGDAVGDLVYDRVSGNLLVTEQKPHLRIFEMTPDGDLVQIVDRPEFATIGVGNDHAAPSIALDPYSGEAYVAVGDAFSPQQIFKFNGFPLLSTFSAVVAGDTDGDGLDDLLVTDQTFVRFREGSGRDSIGRSYVLTGRDTAGQLSLSSDSDLIVQATLMGRHGSALGDLDRDGFDDIAVTRSQEGTVGLDGSAFVFFGSAATGRVVLDPVKDADIVIRQDTGSILTGQRLGGDPWSVTGGDFDHDGRGDLAIGLPTTARLAAGGSVLSEQQDGQVYVFFDVLRDEDLLLSSAASAIGRSADVFIEGAVAGDRLGTLPVQGSLDFNFDGVDDLLPGAAGASGASGQSALFGGRVYVLQGKGSGGNLSGIDPILIANSSLGPYLVDNPSGRPEVRSGSLTVDQPDRWYQFRFLGDGADGNLLRVLPADAFDAEPGEFPATVLDTRLTADLYNVDGALLHRGFNALDLSVLNAGTFYLHVRSAPGVLPPGASPLDYIVEVSAPLIGASREVADRDVIRGGDGDDTIVTGGDDVIFGQAGHDLAVARSDEFRDLASEDMRRENVAVPNFVPLPDAPVTIDDPLLLAAVAGQLDLPVTVGFDGQPHVPLSIVKSHIGDVQQLVLGNTGFQNLVGLSQLTNLRALDLTNNGLSTALDDLPDDLSRLELLGLSDNGITEVTLGQLQKFPNLSGLYLNRNGISDLSALAGIQIIDDGDPAYDETGTWQTEYRSSGGAWQDSYRVTKSGGTATWTLDVDSGEPIELFATWPVMQLESPADAVYQILEGGQVLETIAVRQDRSPGSPFGGSLWQSLGSFTPTSSQITVTVSGGPDQIVAADAVRAETLDAPVINLQRLSLPDNPIDAVSRDEIIPRLLAANPELQIDVTANDVTPSIEPIASHTVRSGSLQFADQVAVLPPEILDGRDSVMIEFWYQATGSNPGAYNTIVSAWGPAAEDGDQFLISTRGNQGIQIQDKDLFYTFTDSTMNVNDGNWHHYAVVRDFTSSTPQISVYVDGNSIGSQPISPVQAGPLRVSGLVLGQDQDNAAGGGYDSNQSIEGRLDDLIFWDISGDSPEQYLAKIQNRYDVDRTTDVAMLAYYRFDEFGGDELIDATGNFSAGILGDLVGTGAASRPAATRSGFTPPKRVPLAILGGTLVDGTDWLDAEGQPVAWKISVDNPALDVKVIGAELQITDNSDSVSSSLVTVTASDGLGRVSHERFRWNVDQPALRLPSGKTSIIPFSNGQVVFASNGQTIPGITIHLIDVFDNVIACTVTDSDGRYEISPDLGDSVARLEVIVPAAWSTDDSPVILGGDADFEYDFESPVLPDFDGNGVNDLNFLGSPTISGGALMLASDSRIGDNPDTETIWLGLNPTIASGSTIDLRLKVTTPNDGSEGVRGSVALTASPSDSVINSLLYIGRESIRWGSTNILNTGTTVDNTDGFHDYRIVRLPGTSQYYVWRDNVLLNNGNPLPNAQSFQTKARLILGAFGFSGVDGTVEVDQLRLTKGLPFVDIGADESVDVSVSKRLDAGGDREGIEGVPQTFFADTDESFTEFRWTVTGPGVGKGDGNASGQTFEFTASAQGIYTVTVDASRFRGPITSDSFQYTVTNAAPVVTVSSLTDLPVVEGTTVELLGTAVDTVATDSVASYRWIVTDPSGTVVDTVDGIGPDIANLLLAVDDEGTLVVTLEVTDNDGATGVSLPFVIDSVNSEPVIALTSMDPGPNGIIAAAGIFTDPGKDFWLGSVDFGDGTRLPLALDEGSAPQGAAGAFAFEHQYKQKGKYRVAVTIDDQDGGTRTESFEIDYQPRVAIEDIVINGGDASRSMISSVGVTFNQIVEAPENAFVLRNRDTGERVTSFQYDVDHSGGATAIELTFLPGPSVVTRAGGNSLADGNYELVVSASGVQSADAIADQMARDFVFGENPTDQFFRMFGDRDGDRDVDGQDYAQFGLAFLKSAGMPGFDAAFDSDGDGDVDGQDYGRFGRQFLKSLAF